MGFFSTHTETHRETVRPVVQTIHEHKAPTDESVRILNEMEEKARENIIRKFVIDDNILNGCIVEFKDDRYAHDRIVQFRFTLNGREHLHEVRGRDVDALTDRRQFLDYLFKMVSELIAERLISEFAAKTSNY